MIETITASLNFVWLMYGPRGGIRTQKPTYRLENGYSIQLSYTRVYLEEDIRFERITKELCLPL